MEGVQPVGGMLSGAKAEDFENNVSCEYILILDMPPGDSHSYL